MHTRLPLILLCLFLCSSCTRTWSPELQPKDASVWSLTRDHFKLHALYKKTQANYYADTQNLNKLLQRSQPYYYYVLSEVLKNNMPSEIALLPFVESNYNPFAYSLAGATGLWQMMPGTGAGMGLTISWWYDGRRDIVESTRAALNYLNYLHHLFNDDWLLAIAAYDAGSGRVRQAIEHNKAHNLPTDYWHLTLPKETLNYIPKLLKLAQRIDELPDTKLPKIYTRPYFTKVHIDKTTTLKAVATRAHLPLSQLRNLNPGFRRWETGPNRSYTLLIPIEKLELFKKNTPPIAPPPFLHHIVKKNETLSGIAKQYHTKIHVIKELNKLTNSHIRENQRLLVPRPPKMWHTSSLIKRQFHKLVRSDHLPGPQAKTYTIQHRDTLSSIARMHHIRVSQIQFWNHLKPNTPLTKGKALQLWLYTGKCNHRLTHYPIKPGDSLYRIARKTHASVSKIRAMNHLHSDKLIAGKQLLIPCLA